MSLKSMFPLAVLVAASSAATVNAQEKEVTISRVVLQVKSGESWVKSGGTLYRLTDQGRTAVADVDAAGKPDKSIRCRTGDRFEAAAESYFDRPTPPPRLTCSQQLIFSFARAVHTEWVAANSQVEATSEPFVFSELSTRTSMSGRFEASAAFSDAAIASTAKLLGDERLEKFVLRDPGQDFKLVFSEAGLQALRDKQKASGVRVTGQLDAATQSAFIKELAVSPTSNLAVTPAVNCGQQQGGQLFCSAGRLPASTNPLVTLPATEFRHR